MIVKIFNLETSTLNPIKEVECDSWTYSNRGGMVFFKDNENNTFAIFYMGNKSYYMEEYKKFDI